MLQFNSEYYQLVNDIKKCQTCVQFLPNLPNPIVSFSPESKIIIIGQAPGKKVHETNIPFNDKSGDNLRDWLGVDKDTFYDTSVFGIVPMGFCFPGTNDKGGDLPPRPECAPQWHRHILEQVGKAELILLVGQYAQKYYLGDLAKKNLTEIVKSYKEYSPDYFPLVHPSPLNFRWQAKNKWFLQEVIPELRKHVNSIIK